MLLPDYAVIDTETTLKCPVGAFSGHPNWPENYAAYLGVRTKGVNAVYGAADKTCHDFKVQVERLPALLVGHNIKFDLIYLHNMGAPWGKHRIIWDTQLAEYVLTSQRTQWATLDDLALKYGGTVKDDTVKKLFAQGIGADRIPYGTIVPYLYGDLENTEKVFLAQVKQAAAEGKLPLIMEMMDALLCTTVMQIHGMKVDVDKLNELAIEYKRLADTLSWAITKAVEEHVSIYFPSSDQAVKDVLKNWTSGKSLSLLLFGGDVKYKKMENVGFYKNGKPKRLLVPTEARIGACVTPDTVGAEKIGAKKDYYCTDDDVLRKVEDSGVTLAQVAGDIRRYRDAEKQYTTYLLRLQELLIGDMVYPSLNHCATITGRLSSNNPNMQNQTNDGPIRSVFISRFGPEGVLMDNDYNQLEMVGLGYVSGDVQLIYDLNHDIDMHTELYKALFGRAPTSAERKPFKRLSFGLVYGAGYKTLAENSGLPEQTTKKFISTFYSRYPGVKAWHDAMQALAEAEGVPTAEMDDGCQINRFEYKSPTGRTYSFRTYPNMRFNYRTKKREVAMTFSPTELKNYPVQGFSTGDIVPLVLARIYRWWANLSPVYQALILPVMTVHDSIVFDVHPAVKEWARKEIPLLMVNVKEYLKRLDVHDFDVIIKVGVSEGFTWGGCVEVGTVSSKEIEYA